MREDLPLADPQLAGLAVVTSDGQADSVVTEPRWDVYFAAIWVVGAAIVEAGAVSAAGRIAAGVALAAMVPWYVFLGRPLLWMDEPRWRVQARQQGLVYLSGLVVLFAVVQSQNPNAWFLAFAICPQCFHVTTVRLGMVFVTVFNVVAGALLAWRQPDLAGALTAVAIVTFAVGFSYVYTRWMVRVIDQSLERAALIAQLESTRAELAAAHHEAGVLAERHRLAGEIHDTLAQGFTSIVTLIQAAALALDPGQDAPRRHLDLALAAARENLAEARLLVTDLGPAALEQASLGDALQRVTGSTGAEAGIRAHAEITGTARPLPTGTEVILLRVCQEALANVRKHAGAQQVTVGLCYADDRVRLTVADDGAGFEPGALYDALSAALSGALPGGFGLPGMRDRVQQAGGTLEVTSAPGTGTQV
ncbi:MAG: sensor histidine kinase, partial [Streptosporangiaceae bacterium]